MCVFNQKLSCCWSKAGEGGRIRASAHISVPGFPDRTKGQCVYVSLANGENALSLLHTPSSPEKSLLAERLLPSQASPDEEGFNPVFKDPKSLV